MNRSRRNFSLLRSSLVLLALLAASLSGGFFAPGGVRAGIATAGALYTVPTTSVMVPAGGSAQLQVRGMSMQPGSTLTPVPVDVAAQPVPLDNVRTALYYGINWGYTETDPQQAVLAVWYAQDGIWHGDKHDTAEQIHSAAASSQGTPSWSPNGRSALQLMGNGQIQLGEVTFTPSAQSAAMGSGTLTLTNTSGQELLVYLPYGTIFGSGPASVLVWAVGEVAQAAQPSSTPEEAQPLPTDTVQVDESTPTATATTAAPPPGKRVPETATASATAEISPTQLPAEAKKVVATVTAILAATDTPVPTDTPTTQPTATSTVAVPPTAIVEQAKPSSPSQEAAASDAAAPSGSKDQNPASSEAVATPKSVSDSNQGNTQSSASSGSTNIGAQAPAASKKDLAATTSEQAAPAPATDAGQGSKTDAYAPVVTITTIPRAVGTSADAAQASVPPAVQTSGATPIPPVQTGVVTVPPVDTEPPSTPTSINTGTPITTPVGGEDVPTRETPPVSTPELVPGEEPKEEVTPEPTRLVDIEPTPTEAVPVIVTDPGATDGDQVGVVVGSDSTDVTPPGVNPNTGGGPSNLPLWLSLSSLVLVMSGWQLRRMAARQGTNER